MIDSSLLFGFIEILASLLTLTASSTILIKFAWGWTGFTGFELPDTVRRWGLVFVGEWTLLDMERFLRAGTGVRLGLETGGADVTLVIDLVRELLRCRDASSGGRVRGR